MIWNGTTAPVPQNHEDTTAPIEADVEVGRGTQTPSAYGTMRELTDPGPIRFLMPAPGRHKKIPTVIEISHLYKKHKGAFQRGIFLSGYEFKTLTGPIVYAWLGRYGEFKYIGLSRYGLRRLISQRHDAIKGIDPRHDSFFLWPCESIEAAERLEKRLIRQCRPTLNKLWNPDCPEYANGFPRRKKDTPPGRRRVPEFRSSYWQRRSASAEGPAQ